MTDTDSNDPDSSEHEQVTRIAVAVREPGTRTHTDCHVSPTEDGCAFVRGKRATQEASVAHRYARRDGQIESVPVSQFRGNDR